MSETTVDNTSLLMGRNNKKVMTLEVAAGALRTIAAGTFVTQKTGDGATYVLHTAQLTTPIDGVLVRDLVIAADAGATTHVTDRAFDGHVNEKIMVANNSLASLQVIPAGATLSYRSQLENKGFVPVFASDETM